MSSINYWDGTKWVSLNGAAGEKGDKGDTGADGAPGADGKDGSGVTIKGTATVYPPDAAPTVGDMWLVADPVPGGFPPGTNPGEGLVWDGAAWVNVGSIRGPKGEAGADGAAGAPGADGAAGADGLGFNPAGAFAACTDYNVRDVVTYLGASYVQIAQPGDACATPDSDPAAWSLLAAAGAAGTAGADGADGRSVAVTVSATQPATANAGDFWIEP